MVVARIGDAQLELPTASEPLAFAHANLSDEYVVVLPTGHAMLDSVPFRVFVTDIASNEDVLRIQHHVLELVLHPFGLSHWPGRLRAPYTPMAFPAGMRRAGLTLVFCASKVCPPPADRALWITPGLEEGPKPYREHQVPVLLADLAREPSRRVASVADVDWELLVDPSTVAHARGAYLVVIEASGTGPFTACDLVYVPKGAELACTGVKRALLMSSNLHDASPPPESWSEVPALPFATFEQGCRGTLPLSLGELSVSGLDESRVRVALAGQSRDVPRYWLARTLFRIALHGYRLGYVETYEGFFYDDTHGTYELGLRNIGRVQATREELELFIKQLYYAVAPEGYTEDLR